MGYSRDQSGLETLDAMVETGAAAKCLIVKDQNSKCVFGHMVPKKGLDAKGYAVNCVKNDVLWLGYSKVILKSDNEPSILALLQSTLGLLRVESQVSQVSAEHPK